MSLLLIALVAAVLVNLLAVISSRSGSTRVHKSAFWSGVCGLATLPVFVAAAPVVAVSALSGSGKEGLALVALVAIGVACLATLVAAGSTVALLARKAGA